MKSDTLKMNSKFYRIRHNQRPAGKLLVAADSWPHAMVAEWKSGQWEIDGPDLPPCEPTHYTTLPKLLVADPLFIIFSKKHSPPGTIAFWGPNQIGYYANTAKAGLYNAQQARAIVKDGTTSAVLEVDLVKHLCDDGLFITDTPENRTLLEAALLDSEAIMQDQLDKLGLRWTEGRLEVVK